ncbi:MAG: hypothetical protein NTX56_06850, partial [Proteobacteria bacterium]|nr:hypothetical protein [Pseudomonadota bacterium]
MMMRLSGPPPKRIALTEVGAVFEEVLGSVIVSQNGRTYKARGWRLNGGLKAIIETAVKHGINAFWTPRSPSTQFLECGENFKKGSPQITFARTNEDEDWVFVLDAWSKP